MLQTAAEKSAKYAEMIAEKARSDFEKVIDSCYDNVMDYRYEGVFGENLSFLEVKQKYYEIPRYYRTI
jgi:hypothetical protein